MIANELNVDFLFVLQTKDRHTLTNFKIYPLFIKYKLF